MPPRGGPGPVPDPIRSRGPIEEPIDPVRGVGPARPIWGGTPPIQRTPLGGPDFHPVEGPAPILGSFKEGGDVPKTGAYKLHEGEHVTPASENHAEERHSFHRAMSHLRKGALHRHLGVAEDKPIPHGKKVEASNSENPHVAKMGQMALNMEKWHKGKK